MANTLPANMETPPSPSTLRMAYASAPNAMLVRGLAPTASETDDLIPRNQPALHVNPKNIKPCAQDSALNGTIPQTSRHRSPGDD